MPRQGYQAVISTGKAERRPEGWFEVMRKLGPVVQASTNDSARYLIARNLTDEEYDDWAMAGKPIEKTVSPA